MIVKAVVLFLIGIGVLGLFGKWRFPGQDRLAQAKCPSCGRYRMGKAPCPCQKGRP